MVKRGKGRSRQNARSQRTNAALSNDGPDPEGDIPRRRRVTFSTVSCPLPRTTQQVTFRQIAENGLSVSNSANTSNTYLFKLNNLDQSGTFQTLFDQYRIDAVRVSIIPQNNAINLVTNTSTSLQELYCVIDYDDATALASAAAARQYDNLIVLAPGESCERLFQPHMAIAAYSGAFTSYTNVAPMWIDIANDAVEHYGIKIWIPQATAAQTLLQSWNLQYEYFVSFRQIR
jgi:hypothetical protein